MKTIKNKHLLILVLLLICAIKGYSQEKEVPKDFYIASTIPDSLKEDANSVLRYRFEHLQVKGPGKAITKIHSIVTILNEKDKDEAFIVLPYNRKFGSVGSFEMRIYDAAGNLLKKYHKSDMYERAAVDNSTLVTDDRIMFMGYSVATYPTTIEYNYEITDNSLIDLGAWNIQKPEQSIQNSSYYLSINTDAGFRYRTKNSAITPQKNAVNNIDTYNWEVKNLKAMKLEEGALSWKVLPKIDFASNTFEYYGLPGDLSSWKSFGKWIQDLNSDVCTLDPQRVAEIKKMTDTLKSDKDKARFLYKYLQQNMRYVSIQLGIGGLKSFPATFVDQKKYGDCKALSTYMRALLKAVDINSYCTAINAGTNGEPASKEFPYNSFNHMILCIPFKGDTTWLECTSNKQPFGKLGPFTENRSALLITEDGGKLVNTPKSSKDDNIFTSEVHVTLDADGGANAKMKILSQGEYRDLYLELVSVKVDKQKEFLIEDLEMKQPSEFNIIDAPDKEGVKEVDMELKYDKFCDVTAGNKLFYRPRVFDLWDGTLPVLEKRKTDYSFKFPMQKSCITTIDIPEGFEVEALPANASLTFTYGNYQVNYVYNKEKNQVVSNTKFVLNNHVIPAAKYTEMQQYMDAIAKAQNKKLVIRRKA